MDSAKRPGNGEHEGHIPETIQDTGPRKSSIVSAWPSQCGTPRMVHRLLTKTIRHTVSARKMSSAGLRWVY